MHEAGADMECSTPSSTSGSSRPVLQRIKSSKAQLSTLKMHLLAEEANRL